MIASKPDWIRATRANPCPICAKPDWCVYTDEVTLCMRVQSNKPSKGNAGGWLHSLDDTKRIYIPKYKKPDRVEPEIDFESEFAKWQKDTEPQALMGFAELLGVDPMSLFLIGCAWHSASQAWAIPMRNAERKIIGIRLRNEQGQKWAIKGSKAGLFIPDGTIGMRLMICEGPSDTACALTLGYTALGRPSCLGNEAMINDYIRLHKIKDCIIISDRDEAGSRGAHKLQSMLRVPSALILPSSCKDLREYVKRGATKEVIESLVKSKLYTPKN